MEFFSNFLDLLFYQLIAPLFILLGRGLEFCLLKPMNLLGIPFGLELVLIAVLTALLSILLRKLLKVEMKEKAFRDQFLSKKKQQENLHLISDWKSREKMARAVDDDIDQDFNSYLAGRFARYGIAYLLPIFLTLYWLTNTSGYSDKVPYGGQEIPSMVVYLVTFCLTMFIYFRLRKRAQARQEQPTPAH